MSAPTGTRAERCFVAALALLATYAFFYEYLPPVRRVHVFSDIQGYHYPLQEYAFNQFKQGRFPQWDPSIYCGITFAGNIQVALFYPPLWLMHAASWSQPFLPFKMMEAFVFAHIWLGFLLCYLWLRGRRLDKLASALGAAVFGYGGYMVSQCVHVGVVTGLAWMPLGLWGIDEAVERRDWRPLWKTALASAMCFLAGYPASWLVFCATTFVYGLTSRAHWRAAVGVCAAVVASLMLAMVQLVPTLAARSFMEPGPKYGGGVNSWRDLIAFFVPNWFDFNFHSPLPYPDGLYLYIGLPALFAIAWAVRRCSLRPYAQALAAGAFCLVLATDPYYQVYKLVVQFPFLENVAQSYNFYEGVAAMAALITALSLHDFLERAAKKAMPPWVMPAAITALAAWTVRQLWIWAHGAFYASGRRALAETVLSLALFSIAFWTVRAESGKRRAWLAAALFVMIGVDYKVFGTSRRFNTWDGDPDESPAQRNGILGMNDVAYRALRANRDYRIACDEHGAPYSTDLRVWDFATPQGFDPFLTAQYKTKIEHWVKFSTNRLFFIDFGNEPMLQQLGIRYVIAHEGVSNEARLASDPNYRRIAPDDSYYRVYEYRHARPPYGWANGSGEVTPTAWLPEHRAFHVRSENGGRFELVEQFFPGWTATVDGRPSPIERWNGAFQSIQVAPGPHLVVFEYHTPHLLLGAAISLAATALLILVILSDRHRPRREPAHTSLQA